MVLPIHGQTMTSFFKQLPIEWTPELSSEQKETLIQKGEFVIPSGDSLNQTKYALDTSVTDYLRCEYYFTTGQSAFISYELRKFTRNDGRQFLVYSKYGGLQKAYSQVDLRIFDIQNNKIRENKSEKLLPNTVFIADFINKETPDSIKSKIKNAVNACYDLRPEQKNEIAFRLYLNWSDDFERWLIGDSMSFIWNGRSFDRKLMKEK